MERRLQVRRGRGGEAQVSRSGTLGDAPRAARGAKPGRGSAGRESGRRGPVPTARSGSRGPGDPLWSVLGPSAFPAAAEVRASLRCLPGSRPPLRACLSLRPPPLSPSRPGLAFPMPSSLSAHQSPVGISGSLSAPGVPAALIVSAASLPSPGPASPLTVSPALAPSLELCLGLTHPGPHPHPHRLAPSPSPRRGVSRPLPASSLCTRLGSSSRSRSVSQSLPGFPSAQAQPTPSPRVTMETRKRLDFAAGIGSSFRTSPRRPSGSPGTPPAQLQSDYTAQKGGGVGIKQQTLVRVGSPSSLQPPLQPGAPRPPGDPTGNPAEVEGARGSWSRTAVRAPPVPHEGVPWGRDGLPGAGGPRKPPPGLGARERGCLGRGPPTHPACSGRSGPAWAAACSARRRRSCWCPAGGSASRRRRAAPPTWLRPGALRRRRRLLRPRPRPRRTGSAALGPGAAGRGRPAGCGGGGAGGRQGGRR